MNQQFISVTDVRANFRSVIQSVTDEGKDIVLVRDSKPEAVIVPYASYVESQKSIDEMWDKKFAGYLKKARQIGSAWVKKKGIKTNKMTEEALYEEIEKA